MKDKNLDFFFKKPEDFPSDDGNYSILHLLRRDVLTCFKVNPNNGEKIEYQALWPGVMTIFAGIDLLSKFYVGDYSTKNVRAKFKNFVKNFLNVNENDAEILWQLRNALVHSFSLYSLDKKTKKEYFFSLTQIGDSFILNEENSRYRINIGILKEKFEEAVELFYRKVEKSKNLKDNFNKVFSKYSGVLIA